MFILNIPFISRIIDYLLKDDQSHSPNNKILQIELIPYKMHGKNVRAVLSPEVWKEVCIITHARNGNKCVECGKTNREIRLECHESWEFPEFNHKIMRLVDLLSLCHNCHMGKHIGFATRNGELPTVKSHLKKLYKLNELQFRWKVYKAYRKVVVLNKISFQLDLTYLNHPRYKEIHRRIGRQFISNEIHNCRNLKGEMN